MVFKSLFPFLPRHKDSWKTQCSASWLADYFMYFNRMWASNFRRNLRTCLNQPLHKISQWGSHQKTQSYLRFQVLIHPQRMVIFCIALRRLFYPLYSLSHQHLTHTHIASPRHSGIISISWAAVLFSEFPESGTFEELLVGRHFISGTALSDELHKSDNFKHDHRPVIWSNWYHTSSSVIILYL